MKSNKTIFLINVDNHIDLITNSSSELFILKGETKNTVTELISSVYPEYLTEYEELKSLKDLDEDELNTFISYHCSPDTYPCKKEDYPLLPNFDFGDLYEPEFDRVKGVLKGPAWNGHIQYKLKNNSNKFTPHFVTSNNINDIKKKLEKVNLWFLFSRDENPNWDKQELLMEIGERLHLG